MHILHVLNFDTVGGVEELLAQFLKTSPKYSSCKNHLFITGRKIHPHFQETVQTYAASVTYEKYFGPFKIPKWLNFLRTKRMKEALSDPKFSKIVFWNRFVDNFDTLCPYPDKVIYYEHGASWMERKESNFLAFLNGVGKVVVNSKAASRMLSLKWGYQKPLTIIENPLRGDIKKKEQGRSDFHSPLRLGFIGRIISLKGVAVLLHAVKKLEQQNIYPALFIAGDGPEKDALIEETKRLQLKNTTFLGVLKDVSSFYDSIDLLIMPSIREPLGLVALEASLRGCPVICSNVDGLPEAVVDGKTGYTIDPTLSLYRYIEMGGSMKSLPDYVYSPEKDALLPPSVVDPERIANTVVHLSKHRDVYKDLSANAIEFASSKPTIFQYTENLLKELK